MLKRLARNALLALSAAIVALTLVAAPASASQPAQQAQQATHQASPSPEAVAGGERLTRDTDEVEGRSVSAEEQATINEAVDDSSITINRWKSATSGFSGNLGGFDTQNIGSSVSREVLQGFMMMLGNASWEVAMNFAGFSSSLNLVDSMVWYVDSAMAGVLSAFMKPDQSGASILGIVTVVALLAVIFGTMRHMRGAELIKRIIVTCVLGALFWGAASALTDPAQGPLSYSKSTQAAYNPKAPTPSWMVLKTTEVLDRASTLSTSIALGGTETGGNWRGSSSRPLGCDKFLVQLEKESSAKRTTGGRALERQFDTRVIVDRLWRESGLRTWVNAQYGANNEDKFNIFCYQLDVRSDNVSASSAYSQIQKTGQANGITDMKGFLKPDGESSKAANSPVVNPPSRDAETAAMLGWSLCDWQKGRGGGEFSAKMGAGWKGFHNSAYQTEGSLFNPLGQGGGGVDGGWDAKKAPDLCVAWSQSFIADSWSDDDDLRAFYVPGHQSAINNAIIDMGKGDEDPASDLLSSMTGTGAGAGAASTVMYAIFTPLGTLPILLVSAGKLLAELVLVFTVVSLMLSIVAGLFVRAPFGEKIGPSLKQMLLVAVVAVGVGTLLSFLLVISNALASLGVMISGGSSGPFSTIWTSVSPLLALIGMGYVWKKVFRAPNPFTPKGLGAWMKGAPAGAAALGGAAGGYLGSRMRQGASKATRASARAVGDRLGIGGASSGRKSSMGAGERQDPTNTAAGVGVKPGKGATPEARQQYLADKRRARIELRTERRQSVAQAVRRPAQAVGLDKESRQRLREENQLAGRTSVGSRSGAWVSHVTGHAGMNMAGSVKSRWAPIADQYRSDVASGGSKFGAAAGAAGSSIGAGAKAAGSMAKSVGTSPVTAGVAGAAAVIGTGGAATGAVVASLAAAGAARAANGRGRRAAVDGRVREIQKQRAEAAEEAKREQEKQEAKPAPTTAPATPATPAAPADGGAARAQEMVSKGAQNKNRGRNRNSTEKKSPL